MTLSDPMTMVSLLLGTRRNQRSCRNELLVHRKRIQRKSLGKRIRRRPKILRMTLLSLTGKCFKASGQ